MRTIFLALVVLTVTIAATVLEQSAHERVQAICIAAQRELNGASEQACGDIQDATGITYKGEK